MLGYRLTLPKPEAEQRCAGALKNAFFVGSYRRLAARQERALPQAWLAGGSQVAGIRRGSQLQLAEQQDKFLRRLCALRWALLNGVLSCELHPP